MAGTIKTMRWLLTKEQKNTRAGRELRQMLIAFPIGVAVAFGMAFLSDVVHFPEAVEAALIVFPAFFAVRILFEAFKFSREISMSRQDSES